MQLLLRVKSCPSLATHPITHCCINEDQKDNFVCNEYRDAILFLISNLTRGICENKLPSILNNVFTKKKYI